MTERTSNARDESARTWSRGEAAWAISLFVMAAVLVGWALAVRGTDTPANSPGTSLFFLLYGIFTISIGYQQPGLGYYSFDRVSQIASILVLGPVDAAWVNGLASLVYPWHRLLKGVALSDVLLASLYNSGMMASLVLICGLGYEALGGPIPLAAIGGWTPLMLVGLVLAMQALNDLGMLGLLVIGGRSLNGFFQPFSVALEIGSGITAVLVALVFNAMSIEVLVLLLIVLTLSMIALRQFAKMRQKLEDVVAERTRSLEEKSRELEELAIRDNLTGLFNRRYADAFLNQQLEYGRRADRVSSVALADIDLFKQINDSHSHATGDEVLKRVAKLLTTRCRKTDMIARYGGEEFLICFPDTAAEQANATCEALRLSIENHDWKTLGLEMPVTISFGVAHSQGEHSPQELIKEADIRLYRAKHRGRNLVVA